MVSAYEVFGAVRELVELGGRGKLGGDELVRAHSLMGKLGDFGFSSAEVSRLVGGRWGASAVRMYGVGSGVVDLSGRDVLLGLVAGFAAGGVDLAAVEECRAAKKILGEVGLDFESAARLVGDLAGRGEVKDVLRLSSELDEVDRTVAEISGRLSLEAELGAKGWTKGFQLKLLEAAKKYGSPELMLDGLGIYDDIRGLRSRVEGLEREASQLESKVRGLESERDRLQEECNSRASEILTANALFVAGLDPVSLKMLKDEAKDLGGIYNVVGAIKGFKSLKQLESEIEAGKKELEKDRGEIRDKRMELRAFTYTLEETRREYSESSDVRQVVALLRDPRDIGTDPALVASLVALVLDSGVKKVEESRKHAPLQVPSMNWDIAIQNMRVLSRDLRRLTGVDEKTTG